MTTDRRPEFHHEVGPGAGIGEEHWRTPAAGEVPGSVDVDAVGAGTRINESPCASAHRPSCGRARKTSLRRAEGHPDLPLTITVPSWDGPSAAAAEIGARLAR
jgi:hypothetical protein